MLACQFAATAAPDRHRCRRCGFEVSTRVLPIHAPCQRLDLNAGGVCRRLGRQLGEIECASCRGRVRVKEFACEHPAAARSNGGRTTLPDH